MKPIVTQLFIWILAPRYETNMNNRLCIQYAKQIGEYHTIDRIETNNINNIEDYHLMKEFFGTLIYLIIVELFDSRIKFH